MTFDEWVAFTVASFGMAALLAILFHIARGPRE